MFTFYRPWFRQKSHDPILVGFEDQDHRSRSVGPRFDCTENMEGDDTWSSFTRHDRRHGDFQVCQAKDCQLRGCALSSSNRTSRPPCARTHSRSTTASCTSSCF